MTSVTFRNEAAEVQELSPDQLDQATGGHNGAIPVMMLVGGAVGIVGGMIAGILGSIFRGE